MLYYIAHQSKYLDMTTCSQLESTASHEALPVKARRRGCVYTAAFVALLAVSGTFSTIGYYIM